jgi:hypothetical protein
MTTLAEGRVDLGQEARRFRVVPPPDDRPSPAGSKATPRRTLFGPFAGPGGPIDLESLAETLGLVLEH